MCLEKDDRKGRVVGGPGLVTTLPRHSWTGLDGLDVLSYTESDDPFNFHHISRQTSFSSFPLIWFFFNTV